MKYDIKSACTQSASTSNQNGCLEKVMLVIEEIFLKTKPFHPF